MNNYDYEEENKKDRFAIAAQNYPKFVKEFADWVMQNNRLAAIMIYIEDSSGHGYIVDVKRA